MQGRSYVRADMGCGPPKIYPVLRYSCWAGPRKLSFLKKKTVFWCSLARPEILLYLCHWAHVEDSLFGYPTDTRIPWVKLVISLQLPMIQLIIYAIFCYIFSMHELLCWKLVIKKHWLCSMRLRWDNYIFCGVIVWVFLYFKYQVVEIFVVVIFLLLLLRCPYNYHILLL
jgi:hypothetical protein